MSDFIPDIKATSDAVVHFLFASPGNEDLLLSFINAVLVDAGQPPVARVTVRNPYSTKNFLHEKDFILDIKAEDEQGRTFTIEFQIAEQEAFVDRILYYWAKSFTGQLMKVLLKKNPPVERAYDEYRHFSQELLDRDREISRDMFHHDQVSREFSARRKVLLSLLAARFGEIPEAIQERVKKERTLEKLDDLIIRAGTCQSLDEFAEALT